MSSLTMPIADAILAAKALLNHSSKDDTTPVICGAAVMEHKEQKYIVATDRYSLGRFLLGDSDLHDGEFGKIIPRDSLVWVSKIVLKALRRGWSTLPVEEGGYGVRFVWSPSDSNTGALEVEVSIIFQDKVERSQTFDTPSGTFPPVARLWREADAEVEAATQIGLSALSLTKIAADVALFEGKDGSTFLDLHSSAGKGAPVQYQLGDRWTAAVQPNNLRK